MFYLTCISRQTANTIQQTWGRLCKHLLQYRMMNRFNLYVATLAVIAMGNLLLAFFPISETGGLFASTARILPKATSLNDTYNSYGPSVDTTETIKLFSGEHIRKFHGTSRFQFNGSSPPHGAARNTNFPIWERVNGCSKWGVVTTINALTESIETFARLSVSPHFWCLLIVADSNTPLDYVEQVQLRNHSDRVVFLSIKDQESIRHRIHFQISFQSIARKNLGYLFVIRHGARVIFDFDDNNMLKAYNFDLNSSNTGNETVLEHSRPRSPFVDPLERTNIRDRWIVRLPDTASNILNPPDEVPLAFNPLPLMNPSVDEIWPRGFPLEEIQSKVTEHKLATSFVSVPISKIGIIQAVCDNDPDVDAFYRLTRPLPVTFDDTPKNAFRLLVPLGRYAPYNTQATTYLYNAFWGLLLPHTVAGRVSDIWRAYFTQRILHDLELALVFTPPIVMYDSSDQIHLADMQAEDDLFVKTPKLLQFLASWKDSSLGLPARIENLAIALYERNYIGYEDVLAMQEWLLVLQDIGYEFPSLSHVEPLSDVMQATPTLHSQSYVVPRVYNLGGDINDLSLYRDYLVKAKRTGTETDWNTWIVGLNTFQQQNPSLVPDRIVMSLVMMVKDEWPLLGMNVLYHGNMLGFENLYILDGSADPQCLSFLMYARDYLGVNVIFTPSDLNHIENEMSMIGRSISGSSDLIAKIDADEFIAFNTGNTSCQFPLAMERLPHDCHLSPFAMKTFFANRQNLNVFEIVGSMRFGFHMGSVVDQELCHSDRGDEIASYRMRVNPLGMGKDRGQKGLTDCRVFLRFDLGGHSNRNYEPHNSSSIVHHANIGILHFHNRCFFHEMRNSRKVMLAHKYISETDSPQQILQKVDKWITFPDSCKDLKMMGVTSYQKVLFYVKYLKECFGFTEATFYPNSTVDSPTNPDFSSFLNEAISLY